MINDIVNELKEIFEEKGHKFFDNNLPYNVNIIGVRYKHDAAPNEFNDHMFLVYRDKALRWNMRIYPITTLAGTHWLKNPMNIKGTAIVKEGQYRGVWKIGKHQNKYKALVQSKPITVYRDNDKDRLHDFNEKTLETGMFGINFHCSNPTDESFKVDKWSAGCQVAANSHDFDDFMNIIEKSAKLYGNSFSYTLIGVI